MVKIIEENRRPSFSDQLFQGMSRASAEGSREIPKLLGQRMLQQEQMEDQRTQQQRAQAENKYLTQLTGTDFNAVQDPEARKLLLQNFTKQKQESKDLEGTFGSILNEMKELKEYVGPMNLAALNPYSETSGKRSQINTLRLSLEGLFRDLTLKGQFPKAIYERILKELPKDSDTQEQYLNKIEAIEKILHSHGSEGGSERGKKMKFNPAHPEHKAKAEQLYKKFGDKEKVRKELQREFEGL